MGPGSTLRRVGGHEHETRPGRAGTWERLPADEAADWRRRLRATERPCGCKAGAASTLVALVAVPVVIAGTDPPHTLWQWTLKVPVYLGAVLGAAVVGKLAGIAWGVGRHRRLQHALTRRLAALATAQGS